MSRALIVGGTGFLGRTLQQEARLAGFEPVVFDLLPPTHPAANQGEVIVGDVCRPEDLDHAMSAVKPTVLFQLAAHGIGGNGLLRSADLDPFEATRVNVLGFVASWQAAVKHGVERFVWSSSTSVFGPMSRHGSRPVDEDVEPQPDTMYGTTKLACERLAAVLPRGDAAWAVGLRLVAIYGAGRYPGAMGAFTQFVSDVAAGRPASLEVNSTPVDWIHVVDAARALVHAATMPDPSRVIYNVIGHRASLEEMARAVAAHAVSPTDVDITLGAAPADPSTLLDDARFRRESGFAPRFDLDSGAYEYVSSTRKE
jgi:nucleoside-diphosphate-sugar epimerase